jgi:hypothetical protein
MTLKEIKKYFLIKKTPPNEEVFKTQKLHSTEPLKIDNQLVWVLFRSPEESRLFDYLQNKNDYKSKEKLFGVIIDEGYAYSTKKGVPHNLQLVLKKPWLIEEKNISRKLEVVVTDIDTDNKYLLHDLYTKVRKSNT